MTNGVGPSAPLILSASVIYRIVPRFVELGPTKRRAPLRPSLIGGRSECVGAVHDRDVLALSLFLAVYVRHVFLTSNPLRHRRPAACHVPRLYAGSVVLLNLPVRQSYGPERENALLAIYSHTRGPGHGRHGIKPVPSRQSKK